MTAIEISTCVLIISGAFTLLCFGVFLISFAASFKKIGTTVEMSQSTIKKVDKVIDDVNYKMNLLNAPVESVARFFDPSRPKFSIVSILMKALKK